MKTVETVSLNAMENFSSFVHATSLRTYSLPTNENVSWFPAGLDEPEFARHGKVLLDACDIEQPQMYRVKQVHGTRVYLLNDASLSVEDVAHEEADALVTPLADRPIAVMTADCVPVVILDPVREVVGVVHAGRKGTGDAILSKTIKTMHTAYGCRPEDLHLGFGPAIGGCCYEVPASCLEPFKERYPSWSEAVVSQPNGKVLLDLHKINQQDAIRAGVQPNQVHRSPWCTACRTDKFYSYRREGVTGRLITLAMRRCVPHGLLR